MVSQLEANEFSVSSHAEANINQIDELLNQCETLTSDASTSLDDEAAASWSSVLKPVWLKLKRSLVGSRQNAKTYLCIGAALIAIGFVPWPQRIACETVCEPAHRRYVAAPFDARLIASHVKTGQTVEAGELLATLDGGELRSELAASKAKFAQASQRQMAALAGGDHSKSENERLEVEHLQLDIDLLKSRLAKLEIRSPIQGVVVSGDLERVAGAPLSIGDNLFEIASLERLVAEIAIPEREISYVGDSMPVSVVLDAVPGAVNDSEIASIHLRNEIRNNESVFIAEVELANPGGLLRPGMNGESVIYAGYRPLGWLLFHRPYDAVSRWLGR